MSQWSVSILTLFPEMFPGLLGLSLPGKALEKKIWSIEALNIRGFAFDKHATVDDTCFGGTPGMVLKPDVVDRAVAHAYNGTQSNQENQSKKKKIVYLTPRGIPLTQSKVKELAEPNTHLIVLCGRYEGVDQRVIDHWEMEEISIGDYILFGGETAAFVLIEACVRLIPGIVGKEESVQNESFEGHLLEHPHYTRPQNWNGLKVPDVLLSGHHLNIQKWRLEQAEKLTKDRRPDLWERYLKNKK